MKHHIPKVHRIIGGTFFHKETILVDDENLSFSRGCLVSSLKYSISIPLVSIRSVEISRAFEKNKIYIVSQNLTIICHRFSKKNYFKLIKLIKNQKNS